MISYIKGTVCEAGAGFVIIEAMNIGYQVFVTNTTLSHIKRDSEIKIFTYMSIKEDSVSLFGFLDRDELEMFNLLITVPGVGFKMAVAALDAMKPKDITLAVLTDDYTALSKAPGIGKKTAQMIALRLKDKLGAAAAATAAGIQQVLTENDSRKQDAIEALAALGYGRSEALKAVLESALPDMTTEQIIKSALRKISR